MQLIIDSIRDAVDKDCLLPATFTALAIPDAMGQCLYPGLKQPNGKRAAGEQYAKWFDKWAAHSFLFPDECDNGEIKTTRNILDGKMCWKL